MMEMVDYIEQMMNNMYDAVDYSMPIKTTIHCKVPCNKFYMDNSPLYILEAEKEAVRRFGSLKDPRANLFIEGFIDGYIFSRRDTSHPGVLSDYAHTLANVLKQARETSGPFLGNLKERIAFLQQKISQEKIIENIQNISNALQIQTPEEGFGPGAGDEWPAATED